MQVMKKLLLVLFFLIVFFANKPAWAENNKFGIHILKTEELEEAAKLVNSQGGDWGYVTIVLQDNDLDYNKWQNFMDKCRKLHLIPIIRLATHPQNNYWLKPDFNDLEKYAHFLALLNWPVKEQLVILFNEPNHALEWGGEINPSEYAKMADKLIDLFMQKNSNFKIMLAGLDQAADSRNGTMKEEDFLKQMQIAVPNIFEKVSAWCSHSYPNPHFLGLPQAVGKATIRGYQWEIDFLKNLGLKKDLPVYITETGWPYGRGYFNEEKAGDFIKQAFEIWQEDELVKAATPFILNYPQAPFSHFSWLKENGEPTSLYNKVLGLSKEKGKPQQIKSFAILNWQIAEFLPVNYEYQGKIKIKNTGQWIIGKEENLQFSIFSLNDNSLLEDNFQNKDNLEIKELKLKNREVLQPGEEGEMEFKIKTGSRSGEYKLKLGDKEKTLFVFKFWDWKNKKVNIWKQLIARIKLYFNK